MKLYQCCYDYIYIRTIRTRYMSIYSNLDEAITQLNHIRNKDPLFYRGYVYEYELDNTEYKECIFSVNK